MSNPDQSAWRHLLAYPVRHPNGVYATQLKVWAHVADTAQVRSLYLVENPVACVGCGQTINPGALVTKRATKARAHYICSDCRPWHTADREYSDSELPGQPASPLPRTGCQDRKCWRLVRERAQPEPDGDAMTGCFG